MDEKEKDMDKSNDSTTIEDGAGVDKATDVNKDENLDEAKELEKRVASEVDRRITEALKKREKALKDEFAERERKAKLTEEQRLKEEQENARKQQEQKERELTVRALKLDLVDALAENEMDLKFRDLISIDDLLSVPPEDRADELKKKVVSFKKIVDGIVEARVAEVKREFMKGSTPKQVGDKETKTVTPYEQAKANNDVKAMIGAKFSGKK